MTFHVTVSEDEHLGLVEETQSMFKIFKEKLLGKGLTGSLEKKRLVDWVCDKQTRHKMRILQNKYE